MRFAKLLLLLLIGGCVFLNRNTDDGTTRLRVRVIDGVRGVPNVSITASTVNGDAVRMFSNASGIADFNDIMPGDYTVAIVPPASFSGLQQSHRAVVGANQTTVVTFNLQRMTR